MSIVVLTPLRFSAGGSDVTPAAVNWDNITITNTSGIENNSASAQTTTAIDATITLKVTLSGGGKVRWFKNGVAGAYADTSSSVSVNSGDSVYVGVSARPSPPTSGEYISGTATVTNESDGAAVLNTFTYEAQYVYPPGPDQHEPV